MELTGQVSTVLITGVVGVFSARYGAKSSIDAAERQVRAALEVAEKNNRAALERIQYERISQKRGEIISELYAALKDMRRNFRCVGIPITGVPFEDQKRANSEFEDKVSEVMSYHDKNGIWLDTESSQATEKLLGKKLLGKYLDILGEYNVLMARIEWPIMSQGRLSAAEVYHNMRENGIFDQ